MRRAWLLLFVVAAVQGCPKSELPPGLPAPEYEQPAVSPWPPAAEAGAAETGVEPDAAAGEPDAAPPDASLSGAGSAADGGLSEAGVGDAVPTG